MGVSAPWTPAALGAKRRAVLVGSEGIALNGGTVAAWTDTVNSIPFPQAAAGAQPTYVASAINGKPGVQFLGTDDYLLATSGGLTGNAPHTIALACRIDSLASAFGYDGFASFSSAPNSSTIGVEKVGADTKLWYGGHPDPAPLGSVVAAVPVNVVLIKRFAAGVITAWRNGTVDYTSAPGYVYALGNDDMELGGYLAATGPSKVTICEAYFCDALDDGEISNLARYLGAKYAITVA